MHSRRPDGAQVPDGAYVLVFAPYGGDAAALVEVFNARGLTTRLCTTFDDLLAGIGDHTLLVALTEEALARCDTRLLVAKIDSQPGWSDLPFVALVGSRGSSRAGERLSQLARLGNITLLDRPVSTEALMMSMNTALRARLLQYQIRKQLDELAGYSAELERRVDARTAALAQEIEERKVVEAALQESRRLESLGRLTGGIAHDFNNLLQVVTGGVAIVRALRPDNGDARVTRALDSILRASANGAKLTQQLLAYARHQPLSNSSIDLGRHARELGDLIRHSLGRQIRLALDLPANLWPIRADQSQLDVAVLNLVFNARDAMPAGGTVTLSMSNCTLPSPGYPEVDGLAGRFVCILLRDEGTGLDDSTVTRAFEPFFTTKPQGKGTGLGLSQVAGFAVQSGGQAFLRSVPGGAMAGLFLPASDQASGVAADETTIPAASIEGLTVLCVEDHYEVMAVAQATLEGLGATVIAAYSADEAVRCDLAGVDLVLSDVMMPGNMDGIDLARHIRARHPDKPVILASGYILDPGRLAELDVTFVQKPYTQDDITRAAVRELARRTRS